MRIAFQRELEHEFVGAVERLTGRKVQAFMSEIHAADGHGHRAVRARAGRDPGRPLGRGAQERPVAATGASWRGSVGGLPR